MRIKEIQKALAHLVGWKQSYNPAEKIEDYLTESESGLTFQGAHPLLTIENIRSIMPEDWFYRYPEWSADITYAKGDKVRTSETDVWMAKLPSKGLMPSEGDTWTRFDMVSDFLDGLTEDGITTMVQTFLQMKELNKETKTLLENRTLFNGAARKNATITPRRKVVGFEFVPARAMGVTTKIRRIGLQMIGATGTVRMYLFHSSVFSPIAVRDLNFTVENGGFQWFDVDMYMPYISDGNNSGGSWYLVYDQNQLPNGMFALNTTRDWSKDPCQTCMGLGLESWREISKYMMVAPFCVDVRKDFAEHPEIWDLQDMAYTNTINYGLNCEITVECDLTDFIIQQRGIFATVLQRQVAATALRTMALNPSVRINRNQSNVTMNDILYEIDGAPTGKKSGLGYELKQAYEALRLDTRGLDRICLACNTHGVSYRSV